MSTGCAAWPCSLGFCGGPKVSLPGVVAAYGWSLSCWFDAHLLDLRLAEVVPMVPRCLPISSVSSHIGRSAPPVRVGSSGRSQQFRGGPEVRIAAYVVPFGCRWPVAAGRACVCGVGWGEAVPMVSPRVFVGACSRFRLAVGQGPGGFLRRRTRPLRRALKISCTKAACAAWASVSVQMVGSSCPDLVDCKDRAQVSRSGGVCRLLVLGDGL